MARPAAGAAAAADRRADLDADPAVHRAAGRMGGGAGEAGDGVRDRGPAAAAPHPDAARVVRRPRGDRGRRPPLAGQRREGAALSRQHVRPGRHRPAPPARLGGDRRRRAEDHHAERCRRASGHQGERPGGPGDRAPSTCCSTGPTTRSTPSPRPSPAPTTAAAASCAPPSRTAWRRSTAPSTLPGWAPSTSRRATTTSAPRSSATSSCPSCGACSRWPPGTRRRPRPPRGSSTGC